MCYTLWFFFAVCFFSDFKKRGCDFTSACRQSSTNRSVSSPTTVVALFAAEFFFSTVRQKVFFLCLRRHTSGKIYFRTYQAFGATTVCSIFSTWASIISVKHNNRVCELLLDVLYIAFRYGVKVSSRFHGIR